MNGFVFTPDRMLVAIEPSQELNEDGVPSTTTPAPRPVAKPQAVAKLTSITKPINVLQLAKARLREVEREIKRLRALEGERDELRRVIDAATNKPRAVVRDITAARG